MSVEMSRLLDALCEGEALAPADVEAVFAAMVEGALDAVQIAGFLVAWRARGERPEELAAAAAALRAAATPFPADGAELLDLAGTGGDGAGTLNISTAAAIVAAAGGARVAKHGNRAVSSKCGSADVLEGAGVAVELEPAAAAEVLEEVGICFLFAPRYHPGLRHAMPVRRALKVRTAFNLLGPLVNPARPGYQLLGVFDPARVVPLAETLGALGCRRALVVHGDGTDELALHGPTTAALLDGGAVRALEVTPESVGLPRRPLAELAGGDAAENAAELSALLKGEGRPAFADAVALNAGAALFVAGRADDLTAGVARARELLASGAGAEVLERWVAAR